MEIVSHVKHLWRHLWQVGRHLAHIEALEATQVVMDEQLEKATIRGPPGEPGRAAGGHQGAQHGRHRGHQGASGGIRWDTGGHPCS